MSDPVGQSDLGKFSPFEGMWLVAKPYLAETYAKVMDGRLLIPYSSDERRLTGHYFDCRVINATLYCRFEHFDSARSGVTFLAVGSNGTLRGGRWTSDRLTETDLENPSRWSIELPGMQAAVWIRILNKKTPAWAEKYFHDDWPNKA
jgi:hypothetical protein